MLGCAPSELKEKHPNLTVRDYYFMTQYKLNEIRVTGELFGFRKQEGTQVRTPPKQLKLPNMIGKK